MANYLCRPFSKRYTLVWCMRATASAVLLVLSAVTHISLVWAAEISVRSFRINDWTTETNFLTGQIEIGDYSKLEPILGQTVVLSSSGGSILEARKIADLLWAKGVKTYVPKGGRCLSACSIIFMSGSVGIGDGESCSSRTMHPTAKVGFHAPYLFANSGGTPENLGKDFLSSVEKNAVGAAQSLTEMVVDGRLPPSLLVELLKRGPREYTFIDTVDKAGLWKVNLEGEIALTREDDTLQLAKYAANDWAWSKGKLASNFSSGQFGSIEEMLSNFSFDQDNDRYVLLDGGIGESHVVKIPTDDRLFDEYCFVGAKRWKSQKPSANLIDLATDKNLFDYNRAAPQAFGLVLSKLLGD